jgi:DNA-binding Xre family transcriptional regulator
MATIHNALPEVMGRHRVKQAALAQAAGLRYATVNAFYNGKTERIDFETLAALLEGLNTLTGETYTTADVLKYVPGDPQPALTAAGIPHTGDTETDAVLNEHPEILDRIAQLKHGQVRLISIGELLARYGVKR